MWKFVYLCIGICGDFLFVIFFLYVGVKDSFENLMEHLRGFIFRINYIKVYYDRAQHVTFPLLYFIMRRFIVLSRDNIARHVFYVPLKHEKKKISWLDSFSAPLVWCFHYKGECARFDGEGTLTLPL